MYVYVVLFYDKVIFYFKDEWELFRKINVGKIVIINEKKYRNKERREERRGRRKLYFIYYILKLILGLLKI